MAKVGLEDRGTNERLYKLRLRIPIGATTHIGAMAGQGADNEGFEGCQLPPQRKLRIFISVGDASADLYASLLVEEMRCREMPLEFWGIGGPRMRGNGVILLAETTKHSAIGLFAALPHLLPMWSIFRRTISWLKEHRPDALVAIDFGAVNRRLSKLAADMGIPTVYYIPPGFWTKNMKAVQRYIHPKVIYVPIYDWQRDMLLKAGADARQVVYLGHPLVDAMPDSLTRDGAEKKLGLSHKAKWDRPVRIALLPGSRICEVENNIGVMVEAVYHAARLTGLSEVELLCSISPTVERDRVVKALKRAVGHRWKIRALTFNGMTHEVLLASDAAIAVTGTVTLEAALLGVPTIAIFAANWLSRLNAIIIHKLSLPFSEWGFVALPNRLLGRKVMPEFALWDCTPTAIGEQLAAWLANPMAAEMVANELLQVRKLLGEKGTSRRVAELIIQHASHALKPTEVAHST